ncbi:MAG: hypothetical protein ACRDF8_00800 [Chloroflexota bacterium]
MAAVFKCRKDGKARSFKVAGFHFAAGRRGIPWTPEREERYHKSQNLGAEQRAKLRAGIAEFRAMLAKKYPCDVM